MVGINLEPVEESYASDNKETLWEMSAGRYATRLKDGDSMEIVTFVGGG